jgi:hypothetical protein
VPIVCTLRPHPAHYVAARLEIAKVLFADSRLFVDLNFRSTKRTRRRRRVIGVIPRCKGLQNTFGSLARPSIW